MEWAKWKAANPSQLTREQRFAFLASQRAGADQERQERKQARDKASRMWAGAREGAHPYLDRKGICSNGSRVLGDLLLIPMRDWAGELHSVQTITVAGEKRFLRGGRLGGCFHWLRIGEATGPTAYVCEGFATGASIHAATGGRPVAVAFCAANLLPACRVLRENLPHVILVVCADNDHKTSGNPGVTSATAAAISVGARLAIPAITTGTDFNDLMVERGIAEVRRQLSATVKPKKEQAEADSVDGF
jgi:putative DNA primase/helicase